MATLTPALAPVHAKLAAMRGRQGAAATHGLAPGLVVNETAAPGWVRASTLISGEHLADLLAAAEQRWSAAPHAAAALAWKSYTYWLALPAVLGWGAARRVPLLDPDDVLVHLAGHQPFLTLGLRRVRVAVLPTDPLAASGAPDVTVVSSDEELLRVLRATLRASHLDPLLRRLRTRARLGERTLLGSLASGVAYGVIRGAGEVPPAAVLGDAATLLAALDVDDLVELDPGPDGISVQRRTCCLAFTLPEPKICSGCCIRRV